MKSISTFNTWDIVSFLNFNPSDSSTWYIKDTEYPKLSYQFVGPEVETLSASDITKTTATISGNLTTLASETTVDVYFRYRTDSGDWINTTPLTKTSVEGYTADLTNLIPGTTYEYSTAVTWRDVGTDYGETLTFTTDPDLIKPTGDISINSDKTYTATNTANLSLPATDDLTDVTLMMVCNNSSFTSCTWENYSSTKSWTVTSGEGNKTVYVKFKDGAGNISSVYSDSIILRTPTVKITDIGSISNVLDKDSLKYYFTSTTPVIKGTTQANSTVTFEYDDETYNTQADSEGNFTISLNVTRGSNDIEYYSTDVSDNKSTTRELTLIVGTENFPEWLLERLGLILNNEEEEDVEDEDNTDEEEETTEEEQQEQEEVDTPPVVNTKKIKFTDKKGKPLAQATVEIEGNTYVTNNEGQIEVENLENRKYTAKVTTKDGKEYSMDILGVGDTEEIVVEVDEDTGINWKNIIIYSGIGLVILVVILILFTTKKESSDDY
jgi:hypothetical protein